MNIIKPKEEQLSILMSCDRNTQLVDRRLRSNGIFFGNIEDVAKNLGITLTDTKEGLKASAPKVRLQIFSEKLHFAAIPFSAA